MPTTPRGYRYPPGGDFTNVPLDIQELAEDVDTDVGTLAAAIADTYTEAEIDALLAALSATFVDVAGDEMTGALKVPVINAETLLRMQVGGSEVVQLRATHLRPTTDTGMDLGHAAARWKDVFLSGDVKDASGNAKYKPLWAMKSANESVVSSTTLQNDDHLVAAVAASKTYHVTAFLSVACTSATPDINIGFTVPTGAVMRWAGAGPSGNNTVTTGDGQYARGSDAASRAFGTINGTIAIMISGVLVVGITAGNLQLQWAQNGSDATAVTVEQYSFLMAREVA